MKKIEKRRTDQACVWNDSSPHSHDIEEIPLFSPDARVPVCSNHLSECLYIMMMHKDGLDIEKILQKK